MRSSLAGPSTSKPKTPVGVHTSFNTPAPGAAAPSAAPPSPTTQPKTPTSPTPAAKDTVRVFAADEDSFPLAQFNAPTSTQSILTALKLHNGGLKLKGGNDTFFAGDAALAANDYVIIGSSGIRVRVTCKGNRMVVPYPFPTHQVQQLMEEIALRFSRFNTNPSKDLKIAELRTLDGYLLNKYDRIMEAVYDEDHLEAIDFDVWITEQTKLCSESWLRVTQGDFVDNVSKWAEVGRHAHGKLYVQIGKGKEVGRLELFEIEDLKMFAKEGQQQVCTLKGKQDNFEWFANVSFVITDGVVSSVILEVKSHSDSRPVIKEVKVALENNQLQKKEVVLIQSCEEEDNSTSERPLPPNKKHEVAVVDSPAAPTPLPLASIQTSQKLKVEQIEQVFADQNWARDGVQDMFYMNFSFTNPNDTIVTIAKVKTEYFVDGKWEPCETAIGSKAGFYNYRMNWNSTNFSIDAHHVEQLVVLAGIKIKSAQMDRLRRAHHSLPQPLKLKVIFEDDQGDASSIEIDYYNPSHDLPTKGSVEKYNNKTYDFWAQLDDKETETRHYIAIARIQENEDKEYLDVKLSIGGGSTYYFYQPEFRKLAFTGVRDNTDEVELSAVAVKKDGMEGHIYAMVDLEKKKVWALKCTLNCNGATLEEYYRITPLKWN